MRLVTSRLALVAVTLLATAASPDGCDPGVPPYGPCAGKVCGDTCRACPPDDASCVETAEVKACDPEGRCVSQGTFACGANAPCAGKACGDDCTYDPPCLHSDPPCLMPSYAGKCDAGGQCWPADTPPDCAAPPSWGCDGKACGEPCGYCPPDADPSTCPVPTFAATACNDKGECVTAGTFTCPPVDPCAGKSCGELCNPCAPEQCMTPVVTACDPSGSCVPKTPDLCYDPCAGKVCGDQCNPCSPAGGPCAAVMGTCDPAGQCVTSGTVTCTPYDACAGKACGDSCSICPPGATDCFAMMCLTACDSTGTCTCAGSDPLAACGPGDACTSSGGTLVTRQCCSGATDFPNTCLIGACGCSAENSTPHNVCACPAGQCYDGTRCVTQ